VTTALVAAAALSRLALGLLAGVALFALLARALPRIPARLDGRLVARAVVLAVWAALEELIWRGLVLGGLAGSIGPLAALVVSSLGFALWHRPRLGGRSAVHVLTGGCFGATFLAGGLAASVLAHWSYNVLVDVAVEAARTPVRRT
jgi:membrane protease YdiL (CAAX protease family)